MYMGDVAGIFGADMMWNANGKLAEAVKHDGTVLEEHAETPKNTFWEAFAQSSASFAFPAAAALTGLVAKTFAAKPKARVLDIACGSGIYGYSLAKAHPEIDLTLLDWPNVLDHTRTWGKKLGVDTSRVKYMAGSLFDLDYGGPYDVILLSHVYHHFDHPTCASLTKKVAGALASGGTLATQDFVVSHDLSNPGATMFAVTMLMWTKHGQTFTADEYRAWMTEAGLGGFEVHPSQGMPASWMLAKKA
jgi:C-methyltransferase